jgi:DNA-directed RNA polymerase subunit L
MEVKIVELEKNYAKIKIKGENHTFLNLLQHHLLEDENVILTKYNIPHPLVEGAEIIIRTDGKNPLEVLKEANKKIIEECDEILERI